MKLRGWENWLCVWSYLLTVVLRWKVVVRMHWNFPSFVGPTFTREGQTNTFHGNQEDAFIERRVSRLHLVEGRWERELVDRFRWRRYFFYQPVSYEPVESKAESRPWLESSKFRFRPAWKNFFSPSQSEREELSVFSLQRTISFFEQLAKASRFELQILFWKAFSGLPFDLNSRKSSLVCWWAFRSVSTNAKNWDANPNCNLAQPKIGHENRAQR